jgi:hypothetical protein
LAFSYLLADSEAVELWLTLKTFANGIFLLLAPDEVSFFPPLINDDDDEPAWHTDEEEASFSECPDWWISSNDCVRANSLRHSTSTNFVLGDGSSATLNLSNKFFV